MAFLDNSGDIILDAVLTDTGRMRLARGDGSFKIAKFALGDDEINYARFQTNHPSGSAYSDLEILQTPILEAFTNNAASMLSTLVSIPRDNILYLPVVKINTVFSPGTNQLNSTTNTFLVAVDSNTQTSFSTIAGTLYGESPSDSPNHIRLDQGLDTTDISPARVLDPLLIETNYMLEIDNRLGSIVSELSGIQAPLAYVDDDLIASYSVALNTNPEFISINDNQKSDTNQVISGPRGTILKFKILSSLEVNTSDALFDTFGITATISGVSVKAINTNIRIHGVNTGYRLDVPVAFIKKI